MPIKLIGIIGVVMQYIVKIIKMVLIVVDHRNCKKFYLIIYQQEQVLLIKIWINKL